MHAEIHGIKAIRKFAPQCMVHGQSSFSTKDPSYLNVNCSPLHGLIDWLNGSETLCWVKIY